MTLSDFKIENDLEFVENKLYPINDTDYGNFINIGDRYLISMTSLLKSMILRLLFLFYLYLILLLLCINIIYLINKDFYILNIFYL